jgi:hypothetical protein
VSFHISEDTAKAFSRDEAKVRSEAVAQTFSNGRGLDYLANVAKRIGATEAYSIIDEARSISRSQESYGADLTTALVKNYARERYGEEPGDDPQNHQRFQQLCYPTRCSRGQ